MNPANVMVPSFEDQDLNITFSSGTHALGMTVGCLRGQGMPGPGCNTTLDIDLYNLSDELLGSTTVAVTDLVNTFIGINSTQPIGRVVLNDPPLNIGPGLLNLWFGVQPKNVPTLSEWGLIAMAGILGMAGFIVMRRKVAI